MKGFQFASTPAAGAARLAWRNRAQLAGRTADSFREARERPGGAVSTGMKNAMIQLTRLNANPLVVNSDLIKLIENAPDTVLTLVTGEKIVVRESCEEVIAMIVEFRRRILSGLSLQGAGATQPVDVPGSEAPSARQD